MTAPLRGGPLWTAQIFRITRSFPPRIDAGTRMPQPVAPVVEIAGRVERAPKHRGWLIGLLVAMALAAVLLVEWLSDPAEHESFFITLLIGIPVGLASTVTIVMARRSS